MESHNFFIFTTLRPVGKRWSGLVDGDAERDLDFAADRGPVEVPGAFLVEQIALHDLPCSLHHDDCANHERLASHLVTWRRAVPYFLKKLGRKWAGLLCLLSNWWLEGHVVRGV